MERSQTPIPQKSNSFNSSSATQDDKVRRRNLSLGAIHLEDSLLKRDRDGDKPDKIDEGEEENGEEKEGVDAANSKDNLVTLINDIDHFLTVLLHLKKGEEKEIDADQVAASDLLPDIPELTTEKFVTLVEDKIAKYESGEERLCLGPSDEEPAVFDAVERISKLTNGLSPFTSNPKCLEVMNLTGAALHNAMLLFEDELYSLLRESSKSSKDQGGGSVGKTKRPPSFSRSSHDQEHSTMSPSASTEVNPSDYFPSTTTLTRLQVIANSMISAGYEMECRLVFGTARRNAFRASMTHLGFEKIAIDDVQRMGWESLEGEIAKWIKSLRQSITCSFPLERDLCYSVFSGHQSIACEIFCHLTRSAIHSLLNFAEAIAMTKRSAEKLFKVLDMYETLKDMIPLVDSLFPLVEEEKSSAHATFIKSEICAVKCRLGEAAFAIFCELENSIKRDAGKNAVPGGAVHPLTRYVMNYLKYACEYINTLEQIFKDHQKSDEKSLSHKEQGKSEVNYFNNTGNSNNSHGSDHTPFEAQLTQVMDLLHSNLESKAKLYKEPSLNNIFLMNNGRYIIQKIKGSPEINNLLGNTWCRKRSSMLRQYHKNYQRETWSKVLACLKDDGLIVKGSVHKPVLKERFKSFNALFDEIHKVQSGWVVSDEQLQSELRVSITAVIVPAYRSFLARFGQYLDAGRQTAKYVKFAPEEVETLIEDLFDGNSSSMVRRR